MKSAKFLAVVCALITVATATNSFAQVKNFEGASVYASTGYEIWSVDLSNSSYSPLTWDTFKPSAVPLNIGLDYTWALGEKNTLGVAVETNLLKSSTTSGNTYLSGASSSTISAYIDSQYEASVVPGFLVSKDTLLYGKLGYYSVRTNSNSSSNSSPTLNGYSYGIGAKTLFHTASVGNNFYVFGELKSRVGNTVNQSGGTITYDMKAGSTSFLLGGGMNF
jgi:hypothetical protein